MMQAFSSVIIWMVKMKHWLPYCRPDNTVKGNSNSLLDHSTKAISFIHTGECSKLITPPRSELFCFHRDRDWTGWVIIFPLVLDSLLLVLQLYPERCRTRTDAHAFNTTIMLSCKKAKLVEFCMYVWVCNPAVIVIASPKLGQIWDQSACFRSTITTVCLTIFTCFKRGQLSVSLHSAVAIYDCRHTYPPLEALQSNTMSFLKSRFGFKN